MAGWAEIKAFVRGTRPRPPPGPRDPRGTLLLVAAAIAQLPAVYVLVRDGSLPPVATLGIGILSMGLAWSGGVLLEGRRRGTARTFAAAGAALGAAALPPWFEPLGIARWLLVVAGACCAGTLLLWKR